KALGRPGWMFAWSVFFTAVILGLLAVGSAWGIKGIGAGLALAHLVGIVVAGTLITRLLDASWGDLARSALPGLALAIAGGGTALLFLTLVPASAPVRLALAAAAGMGVTGLGVRRLSPTLWGTITSGLRGRGGEPGVPGEGILESITPERGP
ncbi:MAG TPA: hypothetical protein VFS51_11190, partial [Gemmatimonadales bacterium]|nr:hypothetical protein [Gemmatimonadales bacterium]